VGEGRRERENVEEGIGGVKVKGGKVRGRQGGK